MRSLRVTAQYLHENHIETYQDLFLRFSRFAKSRADMPGIEFVEKVKTLNFDMQIYGDLLYDICHEKRDDFDSALFEFASSQSWWADPTAQLYFEIDLLNRGFVLDETDKNKHYPFKHVRIIETGSDGYVVEIPHSLGSTIRKMIGVKASFDSSTVEINHNQSRIASADASPERVKRYCLRIFTYSSSYLPEWRDYEKRNCSIVE